MKAAYMAEVEFRHRTFKEDRYVISNLKRISEYLSSNSSKFGIMLCGVYGNGKTTMLYAFQNVINFLVDKDVFHSKDVGIRIIDTRELVSISRDNKEFSRALNYGMIGIEDLGKEQTGIVDYGNLINPVIELIEYRYNRQLFTFITTNLTPKEIRSKYGDRIADRFNEMLEVMIFENGTYRNQ